MPIDYNESLGDMDIIFAGGGTAACVAAGRLAKADPNLRILLVEGGKNNHEDPTVRNPALYLSHLAPDSKTALVRRLLRGRIMETLITRPANCVAVDRCSFTKRKSRNFLVAERPSFLWAACSAAALQ